MVPNLIPITLNFGLMGMLGLPLNPGTAMVAAIAIGIAIDDTIHLMARYGAECKKQPDQRLAARNAIRSESVPIISTSVGLALGFGSLTLSEFSIVAQFGALAAATMVYAVLADLMIMPILLRHLRLATVWDIVALKIDREVIVSSPLFDRMTRYDVKKVVLLSNIQEFEPGEDVVRQGTVTNGMYVVLQGSATATLNDGGKKIELGDFMPGHVFGEIGFSGEGVERTATVTATEPTTIVRLDAESARKGLRFHPRIAARLYRNIGIILGSRLSDTNRRLVQASTPLVSGGDTDPGPAI
jgi:CRP-like cAMP-binding protein